jgi:ATP-binding cassette, subfamily B, bacterial
VSDKPKETINRQALWRLLSFAGKNRFRLIGAMLGSALAYTIERMFMAYIIKVFIDTLVYKNLPVLWQTVETLVIFYVVFVFITPAITYQWRKAVYITTANLRQAVFDHLQRLPLGYHELHHSGDAISILTNDVSAAETAYQQDLMSLVENTLMGIGAVIFMLVLEWKLALLIFASGLLPLVINTLFARPLRRIGDQIQTNLGGMTERMSDLLAGFQVIRTFNLGNWILERFAQSNDAVLATSLNRVKLNANLASSNSFSGLVGSLPFIVGAYLVMVGQTTPGALIGLMQLSQHINNFVYALGGTITRIQAALAAADRIFAMLDTPLEPEQYRPRDGKVALPASPSALLEFKDIAFGYNGDQPVLKGLSFNVQKGQVAAFVGPSGGGKSTIFRLLLGCYPLQKGQAYLSGEPLEAYHLSDLRQQFAYVPQDAYLYDGTILDNIGYGKPGASPEEITTAAKDAYAHDFIMEFPEGYLTPVGERGAHLSGGQRQRIAIARALLKDAPVLLLDEATSALDSESEEVVQHALDRLMQGRTTLAIAHRLSTVENADVIYVIDEGKVVEQGRQAELLEHNGLFRSLHDLQVNK